MTTTGENAEGMIRNALQLMLNAARGVFHIANETPQYDWSFLTDYRRAEQLLQEAIIKLRVPAPQEPTK